MQYSMHSMRITLTVPDKIATSFQSLVRPGERSSVISKLLQEELERRKKMLMTACQKASADKQTATIVNEWQSFDEKIDGKW